MAVPGGRVLWPLYPQAPDLGTREFRIMTLKIVQFLAVVLTALALVPAGAHLFELPNKIGLSQQDYFTVQAIYRGWALFGFVLIPAILANLAHAALLWPQRSAFWLALVGFLCVAGSLAVFFTWTFPTNQATANWTEAPGNWEALRTQWEYSHAVNAVLTFVGLCAATLAVLAAER
jgi:hypothetical protein